MTVSTASFACKCVFVTTYSDVELSGRTVLRRFRPEPQHCEVDWPACSLLQFTPSLSPGTQFLLGVLTEDIKWEVVCE